MLARCETVWWVLVCTPFLLTGCARDGGRPETVPVSGKVTYRGQPVAGAAVAFLAPGAPTSAIGLTNESGLFTLTTFTPGDGAIAGTHVVTVKKYATGATAPPAAMDKEPHSTPDPAAIERAMEKSAQEVVVAEREGSLLPSKYADWTTSELQVDVAPPVKNVEIVLTD